MITGNLVASSGVVSGSFASAIAASDHLPSVPSGFTMIDIAGHQVSVVSGGLYDRYRSNPPLSVIAAEAADVDLSWFKQLGKQRVDMGFESWSPNFYYRNSRVTAIFTADLRKLKELMPAKVLERVRPLQLWPGRGLIALTAYAYHYCDNDSYNEIGLSVITSKPGAFNAGPVTLLGQAMGRDFWGYVLKLPVNTELARVRGVVGYNLPKWLAGINYRETDTSVVVEIFDARSRQLDVTLETRKLAGLSDRESLVRNSFTNVDRKGRLTSGYAISRQLRHASSASADSVKLTLAGGGLSAYIEALKLGKLVKYEYVPEFQSALYAPGLV